MTDLTTKESPEALLEFVKADARVCPLPLAWVGLWRRLPSVAVLSDDQKDGRRPDVPRLLAARFGAVRQSAAPPLVCSDWGRATDDDKAQRLAEQIQWAVDHDTLQPIAEFLRRLPARQWHYRSSKRQGSSADSHCAVSAGWSPLQLNLQFMHPACAGAELYQPAGPHPTSC